MADPITREARPRLVLGGAENAEARDTRRANNASGLVWVLAGLLAFAIGAAAVQSARLDRMTEQADQLSRYAEGLRLDLLDAQAQLHTYETRREMVRESVADLADRVAALYEIVRESPVPVANEAAPTPR